jgi:hypothetical protein
MKALQKFVHLSLIVAFLVASFGFRLNLEHCSMEKGKKTGFFSKSACCCDKSKASHQSPDTGCQDMTCLPQPCFAAYPAEHTSTAQTTRFGKEPAAYASFSQSIRPALLEEMPHFTLPPPASGRFLGILHQTFLI